LGTQKENKVSSSYPNKHQKAIIDHIFGPILVIAPVGTGKTFVLAERVVHAVRKGVDPGKVLCLTFTNRAAHEMQERITSYFPDIVQYLTIKTFHGLCAHMLRVEAQNIGLPQDFIIYDDADSIELIKEYFELTSEMDARDILQIISDCKTNATGSSLSIDCSPELLFDQMDLKSVDRASLYQNTLKQRHALDFADLVFYTRAMLSNSLTIRDRWEKRFTFVQVDEVQDTHQSEYDIVCHLSRRHGNIALIGDIDQTIYEWRGSEPRRILDQFQKDFKPETYDLIENYRATRVLLKAASSFADSLDERTSHITPAESCDKGELIIVHTVPTESEEGRWVAERIHQLSSGKDDYPYNHVAILARTRHRGQMISNELERHEIPCFTVEQYEFFRRQEIKDALAYLRLMMHPVDTGSLQRALLRPRRSIGEAIIHHIMNEGALCGLRLTDMIFPATWKTGDPFGPLLTAFRSDQLVVFDVETTGLSIDTDEVIEISAARLSNGQIESEFHSFIVNTNPVGESESIHHLSDSFLRKQGRPASEVFLEFIEFIGDSLLVGHNVVYDVKMVTNHARRVGVKAPVFDWTDTWNIASRYVKDVYNYRLETLASALRLKQKPTHRAQDDSKTTVELLNKLIPPVKAQESQRRSLVAEHGDKFKDLADQIENWKLSITSTRPGKMLEKVLNESGLEEYYSNRGETKRLQNLKHLIHIFKERDDVAKIPEIMLPLLVEFTALAKNVDHLSKTDNRVPIITIHQAKGLEFDIVFLAGATNDEIPHYYSRQEGRLEEERRLFYVALTRAKRRLFISAYNESLRGFQKPISPFISDIDPSYLRWI